MIGGRAAGNGDAGALAIWICETAVCTLVRLVYKLAAFESRIDRAPLRLETTKLDTAVPEMAVCLQSNAVESVTVPARIPRRPLIRIVQSFTTAD